MDIYDGARDITRDPKTVEALIDSALEVILSWGDQPTPSDLADHDEKVRAMQTILTELVGEKVDVQKSAPSKTTE